MTADAVVSRELKSLQDELSTAQRDLTFRIKGQVQVQKLLDV
jgi:hypothetical protein